VKCFNKAIHILSKVRICAPQLVVTTHRGLLGALHGIVAVVREIGHMNAIEGADGSEHHLYVAESPRRQQQQCYHKKEEQAPLVLLEAWRQYKVLQILQLCKYVYLSTHQNHVLLLCQPIKGTSSISLSSSMTSSRSTRSPRSAVRLARLPTRSSLGQQSSSDYVAHNGQTTSEEGNLSNGNVRNN
jgi:hypothetical protein